MLIVFDIDDTLVDTTRSITRPLWKTVLQAMEKKGLSVKDSAKALFHLWALDQNTASSSETLHLFLSFYKKDPSFHKIGMEVLSKIPYEKLSIKAVPSALEGLKKLRKRYELALVSCGNPVLQKNKLEKVKIPLTYFSKICISEEKDKTRAYQSLLEWKGLPPGEICVVGDRVMVDLKPAKELGMLTVHMKWGRGKAYSPWSAYVDKEVYGFHELVTYLENKKQMVVKNGS